ncbi:hypothetical protein OUZ56_024232 [Daphnia magna]|uniref:Uncharacterized protein n=1 Tax=Daphnia magna TaxID=35525 RepID=A0ABR0B0D5_9CRUS|nr:hypothetical protein OUZ56_024232 [Daphnia magna]
MRRRASASRGSLAQGGSSSQESQTGERSESDSSTEIPSGRLQVLSFSSRADRGWKFKSSSSLKES